MMDNLYNWFTSNPQAWISIERTEDGVIIVKDDWYEYHIQEENNWFYVSIGYNDDDWKIYRRVCQDDCASLIDWFWDNISDWLDDLDNSIMLHSGSHCFYGKD